jgi:colanic acid biosynthesis glycosyl transferase WcaI
VRILIHGLNFAPELVGVGKYTGEMAEWLAARGHEVRAVTAPPFNPEWKVAPGFSPWRYSREGCPPPTGPVENSRKLAASGGLTVLRCPLWVPRRPSGATRILHLTSFALASFLVMLRQVSWKPEIVLVVEPTLFCLPAALITGRFCKARTWLHVQDFEADAGFDLGLLKSVSLQPSIDLL